jgi:ribosomal protein S6--L-glutamate ligase
VRTPSSPKRLCILSRSHSSYSTSRLQKAAEFHGAEAVVLDTLHCALVVAPQAQKVLFRGEEIRPVDVVIPRISPAVTSYGMAVVNHFDAMNVPVVNGASAIARSRDKVRCLQVLVQHGIPVPRTVMAHGGSRIKALVDEVGGFPCIIKLLKGTQGVGVMLANTLAEAKTMVQTFWALGQDVCLQEFIAESSGRDVRALVVGDKVVGAMRRVAKGQEFRSNIHRGGEGTVLHLDSSQQSVAVRAAKAAGLHMCGVDMLESKDGPKVIELNSSPGFEGLEKATQKDIASEMVRFALSLVTR